MNAIDKLRKWVQFKRAKKHNGKCDLCDAPFIIWLEPGSRLLCWDHYCEAQRVNGEEPDTAKEGK